MSLCVKQTAGGNNNCKTCQVEHPGIISIIKHSLKTSRYVCRSAHLVKSPGYFLALRSQTSRFAFKMTESELSTGGKTRRLGWRRALALLTIFCAVGGAVYITKAREQIHKAVSQMINGHFRETR